MSTIKANTHRAEAKAGTGNTKTRVSSLEGLLSVPSLYRFHSFLSEDGRPRNRSYISLIKSFPELHQCEYSTGI